MINIKEVKDPDEKQRITRLILEELKEWFEVEESREGYIKDSANLPYFAAYDGDKPVGFICLFETGKDTVEIHVTGVLKEYHGKHIGRKLLEKAKKAAKKSGHSFLQVKTVQMGKYEDYDRTNRAYIAWGFKELEVFPMLWDEDNPCQIYVMELKDSGDLRKGFLYGLFAMLMLFLVIGFAEFLLDTNEHKSAVARGEYDDYHNQPNNEFGAPVVYYRSDLERVVGVRLRESDESIGDHACTKYWNNRNETTTIYDDMTFFIFDKESEARDALAEIKEHSFREITDVGDNYVRGWLDGVMDADIEEYYYVNGNLMVVTTVTAVDESARPVDDPDPGVWGGGEEAERIISLINETF